MGDFSVSCFLTGVTIPHGAEAVLIPLAPSQFGGGNGRDAPGYESGAVTVSNEGACALFAPVALPLFGRIGCYGALETIHEDANTHYLVERLRVSLDEFAQAVARGGATRVLTRIARRLFAEESPSDYRRKLKWSGQLYGCWTTREAWDHFSTRAWSESDGSPEGSTYNEGWLNPENLRGMGFVEGEKDEAVARRIFGDGPHQGDRYNTPWTHPDLDSVVVWCDDHMSSRVTLVGVPLQRRSGRGSRAYESELYRIANLDAALRQNGRALPASSVAWAKSATPYHGAVQEARRAYQSAVKMRRLERERAAQHPTLARPGYTLYLGHHLRGAVAEEMIYLYRGRLYRDFARDLEHLLLFGRNVFAACRLYRPEAGGYQYGHPFVQREVARLALRQTNARIKERRARR